MVIDENFALEQNQVLKLSKDGGYTILEFSRPDDQDLDDIIEFWKYDSRKSNRGESTWLTEKDFKNHVKSYLISFPITTLETKSKKNNTK